MAEKRARQKRYSEEFKLLAAKLIAEGGQRSFRKCRFCVTGRIGLPLTYVSQTRIC